MPNAGSLRRVLFFALFLSAAVLCGVARAESVRVESPSGRVVATVEIQDGVCYRVEYDGVEAIGASRLGLIFHDAPDMTSLKLVGTARRAIDETTTERVGRKSVYVDRCVETTLQTASVQDSAATLNLIFRAYDDALAFRYEVPEGSSLAKDDGLFRVDSEATEFAFGQDRDAIMSFVKGFNTDQQGIYRRAKLSELKKDSFVVKPLVVETDAGYVALAESDLLDWAGMQFAASADDPATVAVRLTPRDDGQGCVMRRAGARSPWRVVVFGKTFADLYNHSDVVYNCATPAQIDASWVRPGNSSWDWWAPKGAREISDAKLREFVDFSADAGWEYTLVDAGWYRRLSAKEKESGSRNVKLRPSKNLNLPECVKYAREKGVGVLLWIDWPDLIHTDMRQTFQMVADWGVAGLKIDHMNSHSQETVAALTDAVKLAAEYKLLVNFHGMYVPTGMERTYPNQITREAIRGNEYFRGSALPLGHAATLLFTRNALGPSDYTPGGFRNEHLETYKPLKALDEENASCRVVGTRAHELALCMLFDSPLRCYCDLPSSYRDQPGLEFLSALPGAWDDTKALAGAPDEFAVMARRSGATWFVSAITNDQPREIATPLDFLDADAEYDGTFYVDAPESDTDATAVAISTRTFRAGDVVEFRLAREGGANLVLKRR